MFEDLLVVVVVGMVLNTDEDTEGRCPSDFWLFPILILEPNGFFTTTTCFLVSVVGDDVLAPMVTFMFLIDSE